jgi:hypothetical protein
MNWRYLAVASGVGAALLLGFQCPNDPKPHPITTMGASKFISFEALAAAARAADESANSSQTAREYVAAFATALRPYLQAHSGKEIALPPIDARPSADALYANWRSLIKKTAFAKKQQSILVFRGDEQAAKSHTETVSLYLHRQCTGIIIARNAIATATHCADDQPTQFRIGDYAQSGGKTIQIDPTKFITLYGPHHETLDMSVLITCPQKNCRISGVNDSDLPVFANDAQIAAATELLIVGFGGYASDTSGLGTKRAGLIPMASPACAGPDDATDYKCLPDLDILAGARTFGDYANCPTATTPGPAAQQGACKGDSGGPAFVNNAGTLYLAGLIKSHSDTHCDCADAMNVYARFDKQITAIRNMPGINFPPNAFSQIDAAARSQQQRTVARAGG